MPTQGLVHRKRRLVVWNLGLFLCYLQVMDFYCQSCETAMCRECTEGEHAEHPTVPLKDVVEQHKASLQVQLDAVNKRCAHRPRLPTGCASRLASGSPLSWIRSSR